jgi:two-component system, chemotaxis family, CheB/CheR fusion protein
MSGANNNLAGTDYVIGIGASAGGLDAINELFDNMPDNTGFSFVVIQHLSPDYKSLMAGLLARHTSMEVHEAENNMPLKPNAIYLLPSKKLMTISEGQLKLKEKVKSPLPNTAIDTFLLSLAEEKKDKAIGIILSGTGTDGSKGIEAIKSKGGIVVVQDPITAEFDGMPNSAISTGCADLILSPEMMPEEILEFVSEAPLLKAFNVLSNQEEAILKDILELIHQVTAHDYSFYKRPTINRRLLKRMAEKNIKNLADYYNYLRANHDEVIALCKEFLINVTKFFRDEEAFDTIRTKVIPALFEDKSAGDSLKLWVVACSTGEEAYSMAMLLDDYMEANKKHDINVKIFATDIDQASIETASRGVYSEAAVKDLPKDYLDKYFAKEGNGYRVSPPLRKMVVFAKHDITKDPPFSRIELLSCRNMLIYMNPVLQKSILRKFNFALNVNGYLFLGPSESLGYHKESMQELDKKWKIYKYLTRTTEREESFVNPAEKTSYIPLPAAKAKNALNSIADIFKDTLLEEHDYTGILIDLDFEVKQATGNFKNYLTFPEGNFNFNLMKMVHPDLSIPLMAGVRKAIRDNQRVVIKKVKMKDGKNERCINVIIKPYLDQKSYVQPFVFVVLNEEPKVEQPQKASGLLPEEMVTERITELENELRDTRENLQAVVEEVESANEELQSSNEEIVSANEELQSTNEELQSLNEELHTVNAEHQAKIRELMELNDDMNNYFNNSEIGQILIDRRLTIRKFTPSASRQVNVRPSDIGRSIIDISTNFDAGDFINDIKRVVRTGYKLEKEVVTDDKIFLMRIVPYVRMDQKNDGVVVSFIDISEVRKLNNLISAIFNSSPNGIVALKPIKEEDGFDFLIESANETAAGLFSLSAEEMHGKKMTDVLPELMKMQLSSFQKVYKTGETATLEFYDVEKENWLELVLVKMSEGLLATFNDITERKRSADLLAKGYEELKDTTGRLSVINQQLEQSNLDLLQFASVASHDLKEPLRKIQAFGSLLKTKVFNKLGDNELGYLDKMIFSASRMQMLIDDILNLSKLSNKDAKQSITDLNDIIRDIKDDLEVTISEKEAILKLDKLTPVKAIPGQMHQLFQNLIVNAMKFTDGRQPEVHVYQEEVSEKLAKEHKIDPKNYIAINVRDNGIGFEPQYREKIFGIFQRLEGHKYQGAGIGLAICKKIVENHNGFIRAESKPGEGTTFTIILPKGATVSVAEQVQKV